MHDFSYRKFSMICLKGEAFFWFGFNFLQVLRFRECSFFKHANYLCLPSFSGVIWGFYAASSHECFIISILGSWHCGIYNDFSFYFLIVLCSKLRYILTGFFFLQAINYVFCFFGWFLVGKTSSKYCLMTVFCRVFFFYGCSF